MTLGIFIGVTGKLGILVAVKIDQKIVMFIATPAISAASSSAHSSARSRAAPVSLPVCGRVLIGYFS